MSRRRIKVFTEIVNESGSPALLEYYGNQLIRTKIPQASPRAAPSRSNCNTR